MNELKSSKIKIRQDKAVGSSSTLHGHNIDAVGFNIRFILEKRPSLGVKIVELYKEAAKIKPDDPQAPDEDFHSALEKFKQL